MAQWVRVLAVMHTFHESQLKYRLLHYGSSFLLMHLGRSRKWLKCLGPYHPCLETWMEFWVRDLGLTWPHPSCCGHLVGEQQGSPVGRRLLFILPLSNITSAEWGLRENGCSSFMLSLKQLST